MRLSSHDASFLYTETASGPMHGAAITVLDGEASFAEIFSYYAARVHLIPRFRQKLAFVPFNIAHPKWIEDPDFKLENHLKPHAVPPGTSMERAIEIALDLAEPLLDRSRPLWMTYVLEHIEGKTLIVQLTHHAFVDGATFVAISTLLSDPEPDPPAPEPEAGGWNPPPEPAPMALWQEAAAEQARAAVTAISGNRLDSSLLQKGGELMQRMARPVIGAPWNAGLVGPKRRLAYLNYRLDDLKAIRKPMGGTVNDVAVAVVAEAAARYMSAQGVKTDGLQMRLMCPVNVRTADDDAKDMSGNKVSAMFPLLNASPMSAADRYAEVINETASMKARGEPETLEALQEAAPPTMPVAMAATLAVGTPMDPTQWAARLALPVLPNLGNSTQQAGFNFTVSNVPGPPWTQYVAGYRIVNVVGTLMLSGNLGLGVTMGSFDGNIVFNFTCDPRLVPEVSMLKALAAEVFDELSAHAAASVGES